MSLWQKGAYDRHRDRTRRNACQTRQKAAVSFVLILPRVKQPLMGYFLFDYISSDFETGTMTGSETWDAENELWGFNWIQINWFSEIKFKSTRGRDWGLHQQRAGSSLHTEMFQSESHVLVCNSYIKCDSHSFNHIHWIQSHLCWWKRAVCSYKCKVKKK